MFYLPNNIELIFSSEVANLLGEIIILNFISLLFISFCSFFPNIIQPLFLAFSFFFKELSEQFFYFPLIFFLLNYNSLYIILNSIQINKFVSRMNNNTFYISDR